MENIILAEKFYHTQESRRLRIKSAVICKNDTAWLGEAFYFWKDILDAEIWGHKSKNRYGYFEVYECDLDFENVLDTVFNETHYNFWVNQIEKVANHIISKTKMKPTIKELNDYLKEKGTWDELDGIQFQDLPTNENHLLVKPIQYKKKKMIFAYRKRIQVAVYNPNIISNFAFSKREQCINI